MPPKGAKLKRATTIQQTVKASEAVLGSSEAGVSRKRSRSSTASAKKAPAAKKVKLAKQKTMKVTAAEGKNITKGKARGKTRGKTAAKKPKVTQFHFSHFSKFLYNFSPKN